MERHTYKVCRVLPRDPEQKMGRPRREVLMPWEDLSDDEVKMIRAVQEPRLKADEIAELDKKIVARGSGVTEEDVADAEDADDGDDADDAKAPSSDDPVAVTKHATRMLWDAYRKHAAASAELREQTNELNKRAIEQARQLDEALNKRGRPGPTINITAGDISNLVRAGTKAFQEFVAGGSPHEPHEPESK